MGATTGIKWTDSTYNSWWGCTKVSPACDHCYAEATDRRTGASHWGRGAPRMLLSDKARNAPYVWNSNADTFFAEHGRKRRVFTLSMGDLFDNEVPHDWRASHMETMAVCDQLEWQICTKRASNIEKMVPLSWTSPIMGDGRGDGCGFGWPGHIGVLITCVTQAEADRDIPRLLSLKKRLGVPWVGVSYEPALEPIDFADYVDPSTYGEALDWIIFGGESGANFRTFDGFWEAAYQVRDQCARAGCAFFMKQAAARVPRDDMIPASLMVRQFPDGRSS